MSLQNAKIIHIDLDAFYASVEQRDNPQLRGQPVAVGGDPGGRGVVAAASYEARRFGVTSAMPSSKALRLCPQLNFVRPRFQQYKAISREIHSIFGEVTDIYEPLSLDEAYLDVTENKLREPSAQRVAVYLKSRIRGATGLTASAGVAPVKFVAKIASGMNKPNGLTVVGPSQVDDFVKSLPVERLWGVGPATQKKLKAQGVETVTDLRELTVSECQHLLGKYGLFLHDLAYGRDPRSVEPQREPKSRGAEKTFSQDVMSIPDLERVVESQAKEVAESLEKRELRGRTVTLKVRYNDFMTITRSRSLHHSTGEAQRIAGVAKALLNNSTEAGRRPIRLLGVSVSMLEGVTSSEAQLSFW